MATNMADLFGESDDDDDDDFAPFPGLTGENTQQGRKTDLKEGAEPLGGPETGDQDDDNDPFDDIPAPTQPAQLREYSDEDEDDEGIVKEDYERLLGPPAELAGPLLPLPAIDKLRLLQTSKFLGVQTLPMTPENLKRERESADFDEGANDVRYSYKKQLTIRWRERRLPSGETVVESNARFVTWSDGSRQLLLGDEVLDVGELENTSANQFLFARPAGPKYIQGQGQLTKKMQLRPATLSSKFHKELTADAQKKHVRVSRVKATATIADPNRAKADREKAEEERIKSREMLQRRQVLSPPNEPSQLQIGLAREADKEMRKYPAVQRREYRPTTGITPHFLETIEDEPDYSDDEDLTATERARSALQRRQLEEEEEREAEQRLARAKQAEPRHEPSPANKRSRPESTYLRDPEAQRALLEESDEDEEEDRGKRQPAKKIRRGLVLSDDEDE